MNIPHPRFRRIILLVGVVMVLAALGFVLYRHSANSTPAGSQTTRAAVSTADGDSQQARTVVTPRDASNTYTVAVPQSLLPYGSCKTQELLFGLNDTSTSGVDNNCRGLAKAAQYAAIVFGVSSESIAPTFGSAQTTEKVTVNGGKNTATKYVVTAHDNSAARLPDSRYVMYEAPSKTTGRYYYAVYRTELGSSQEDKFLQDFELVVKNGWSIP